MAEPRLLEGSAEFVAHVYYPATGPGAPSAQAALTGLWDRCCERFDLARAVPTHRSDLRFDVPPGPGGVLAARCRGGPGPGVHEIVVRRLHDTIGLALLRAPGRHPAPGRAAEPPWAALEAEWAAVVGTSAGPALGAASILQAVLADGAPVPAPDGVAELVGGPPTAAVPVWGPTGRSGSLACWEDLGGGAGTDWDVRQVRRIVVLAPAGRDAELSAWTWSRGGPVLTPFAQYLRHAAILRYEMRVFRAAGLTELRHEVDAVIGSVLQQVGAPTAPDRARLSRASIELLTLRARAWGLVDRLTRVRELERAAAVAARNMAAHAPDTAGLFADDRDLAELFARQLDGEQTSLGAVLDRSREASALADQVVQRGREGVDLALTGVVGALLMVLAAIQAFGYRVPVPEPVQPAVIAALGSVALLASSTVVRAAGPERSWTRWAQRGGALVLVVSSVWIVLALIG